MNKEAKILGLIALVVIAVAAIFVFKKGPVPVPPGVPLDSKNLVRDTSHMTGKKDAKVTLIEFGDYECPACKAAEPILEQILNTYKSNPNFNFVFRNFPLTEIHPYAEISAEATEAAAAQGKFWEMHNLLYEKQTEWVVPQAEQHIVQYAKDLGLDVAKFQQALTDKTYSQIVQTDRADGDALQVNATPTFFLNGKAIVGAPTLDNLKSQIDEALK